MKFTFRIRKQIDPEPAGITRWSNGVTRTITVLDDGTRVIVWDHADCVYS